MSEDGEKEMENTLNKMNQEFLQETKSNIKKTKKRDKTKLKYQKKKKEYYKNIGKSQ